MPTNIEIVLGYKAQLEAEIAERQAKLDAITLLANCYTQIGYNIEAFAERCRKRGKLAVLGDYPPAVAMAYQSMVDDVQPVWVGNSPLPWPEMPDEPVPEPEPEPEGAE